MICSRCIYDDSIPYISFDSNGVCNYCRQYDQMDAEYPTGEQGWKVLTALAERIKHDGRGKQYDVVVGVSGGCDSSYMLHVCQKLGLRPLACHFDNTWDSKIAVENIYHVTRALGIDLYTHVVDNKEFCDIFLSFLKASVPDIDTPSDIGLAATHYRACRQYGIRYIFEGHSFRTEGVSPHGWFYMDAKYIQSIHNQFGRVKMKTFPNLWISKWLTWTAVNRIRKIRPLYYIRYVKEDTKEMLSREFGWKWYGGHHMENRTAYFTNNYYLPRKFGIDLRYCEFSALVRSGQMTRARALDEIQKPKEFDRSILEEVKKRCDLSEEEFEGIMNLPKKSYRDYTTYKRTFERMKPLFWAMYKLNMVPKSFYMKYTKRYDD